MTTIYLIRHCEAEGNLYRRAQGHWNGKVTARGLAQLDKLAERFADVRLDAVYSSDLDRAVTTARAVAAPQGLEVRTTQELREICMGVWEGQPWGQLQRDWPEQMQLFNHAPEEWAVPGAESFDHCQRRMTDTIKRLAAENDGRVIAIASHGMAIKIFLMGVIGMAPGDPDNIGHGDNTSVSLLKYDDGALTAEYCNDNSHLDGETSTFARQKWWRQTGLDPTNMYFEPLDPRNKADARTYCDCYSDSWCAAHGNDRGFVPNVYLAAARAHAREDGAAIVKVMSGGELAGVVELDPGRGVREGFGWISLLYLCPDYRGKGLGAQLIGYTAAYYEAHGRKALRLHAAATNEHAIGFYRHFGFEEVGRDSGVMSEQLLMEKYI